MTKIKKWVVRLINLICTLLIVVLVILVGYFSYSQINHRIAFVLGVAVVRIESGSMEPAIMTGDYVLVERAEADDIREGDVITFYSGDPAIYGLLNTHRVVEIAQEDGQPVFTTKGDNNAVRDAYPVYDTSLAGRFVKTLPILTAIASFLMIRYVFILLILIPAVILVVFSVRDLSTKSRKIKMDQMVREEVERMNAQDSEKK